uniref:Uncharacterized protein n=1 Tax=Arundo donax TaxID=35708 RepID=A0A0A9ALB7_ARUDO
MLKTSKSVIPAKPRRVPW